MSINSFDRLQKEIDALTYNARSILQALQESALAGGTSKGFRITRADKEITLTRVDIYRLYTFYQEWESNNFAVIDEIDSNGRKILGFNTIRINHDKKPVRDDLGVISDGSATTTALAKHGRIMYMTGETVEHYLDDSFWYSHIASATNPKLITNSSPIPINLRTPIFDPNLSTTHYNTHPTYLLPNGYHLLDILGYDGDGKDHYLDGDRWSISAKKSLILSSDYISIGKIDQANVYKTSDKRVGLNSIVWGYNTFAQGEYSTAGGYLSAAIGGYSNAIGYKALASGDKSSVIGGDGNYALFTNAGVFSGTGNKSFGMNSVCIGGIGNSSGEPQYEFYLDYITGTTEQVASCMSACNGTDTTTISTPGYRVVRINISIDKLALSVGDVVVVYALKTRSDKYTSASHDAVGGSYYTSFTRTITGISRGTTSQSTVVTFDLGLPVAYHVGGFISRVEKNGLNSSNGKSPIGYNSATIGGSNLIASGRDQLTIGHNNRYSNTNTHESTYNARLIIGSGTTEVRKNILEVYDNAIFCSLLGKTYGDAGFHGIAAGYNYPTNNNTLNNVSLWWDRGNSTESMVSVMKPTTVANNANVGITLLSKASILLSSEQTILLSSMIGVSINSLTLSILTSSTIGVSSGNAINISANTAVDITSGTTATLKSSNKLILDFGKQLTINGDNNGSYGTLFMPGDGTSFTKDSTHQLRTNTIMKSSVAEVYPTISYTTLGKEYPPDTYMGLNGSSTKKAHVLTLAGLPSNGSTSVLQMLWGQCTPENLDHVDGKDDAWTGALCIRKGIVTNATKRFTPWEPLVARGDMDGEFSRRFNSSAYSKSNVDSIYGCNGGLWSDSPWIHSDLTDLSYFNIRFVQSGLLTTCMCEYKFRIDAVFINETDKDGIFVMVILKTSDVFSKPLNTAIGAAVNPQTTSSIKPTGSNNLTLYSAFIGGRNDTLLPNVSDGGEVDVDKNDNRLKIFIPVPVVNETNADVIGRFTITYENTTVK